MTKTEENEMLAEKIWGLITKYVSEEDLKKIQAELLSSDLHQNENLPISNLYSQNKNLNTVKTNIVGAINELLEYLLFIKNVKFRSAEAVTMVNGVLPDEYGNVNLHLADQQTDVFKIGETEEQRVYKLTKTPEGTPEFYMNGVRYFYPDVVYNKETNTMYWNNDELVQSLNLNNSYVVLVYYVRNGAISEEELENIKDKADNTVWKQINEDLQNEVAENALVVTQLENNTRRAAQNASLQASVAQNSAKEAIAAIEEIKTIMANITAIQQSLTEELEKVKRTALEIGYSMDIPDMNSYVSKYDFSNTLLDYATKNDLNNGLNSVAPDLSSYVTKQQLNNAIADAIPEPIDISNFITKDDLEQSVREIIRPTTIEQIQSLFIEKDE